MKFVWKIKSASLLVSSDHLVKINTSANFCTNLDTLMDHINNELPICSVLIGNFNAKCSKWCNNDITNASGRALDTLTSSAGYTQIILYFVII